MAGNRRGPGRPPGSRNKTEKHAAEGKNGTKSKSKQRQKLRKSRQRKKPINA